MGENSDSDQLRNYLMSNNLQIFSTHKELIERVSFEIAWGWKIIPIVLYFLCAISGYASSILFYIFWHDIFSGNCPLWATMQTQERYQDMDIRTLMTRSSKMVDFNDNKDTVESDWRKNILITFLYEWHCRYYQIICLSSCAFGVIWCLLFTRCATGIYAAQWLIVPPALIFQTIFTALVYSAAHDFEHGYYSFTDNLKQVAFKSMNSTLFFQYPEDCNLVDYYLKIFHFTSHDLCQVHKALKILSWTMAWSWIGGLAYLILRIVIVNDFRLLRTIVYKIKNRKTNYDIEVDPKYIDISVPKFFPSLSPRKSAKKPFYWFMV